MSSTGGDGLIRRGANDEGGLSESKIESARRFLYDEEESFGSLGDGFPVSASHDGNSKRTTTGGHPRTNLSNSNNNTRIVNTALYYSRNMTHRTRKILIVTALTLVVIGCATFLRRNDDGSPQQQQHLHGSRLKQFQSTITEQGITSIEDLENPETPQYLALQWVANSDKANLKADDPLVLQRYALAVLFYFSNDGEYPEEGSEQWNQWFNWRSESGVCSWRGVVCEGDSPILKGETGSDSEIDSDRKQRNHHGLVQTLELPSNHMKGSLPSELSALHALYKLDLSHNAIVGPLPKTLGSLTGLRTLVLRNNFITGTIPQNYGHDLSNLRELVLAENMIQGKIPSDIEHMVELRILDVSKNRLTGTVPGLEDLIKLRQLVLEDNKLQGKFPESLSKLKELVVLNLGKNHFTGVLPEELSQLTQLGKKRYIIFVQGCISML